MSTTIDNHVVRMEFDNKNFEKGAQETINSIDKLKESIKFDGATQGLNDLSKAINNVDTKGLQAGVEEAGKKFSFLEVLGLTAMVKLSNAALDLGKKLVSSLTAPLNQIKSGGWSRAMNLENAKFQLEGLGMDVAAVMKDVDYAVSGTAYSLDAAAKAAASLGASGVKAGDQLGGMARSLRAISGVAAMTNSDYESIAQIFATVAGNGKLMTMQLRQFSAKGLNVAAELAKQLHKSEAEINDMVTKGQIDFQTFQEAMMEAFGEHAVKANETFQGALANIKSALSRVGETFATPIIQNAIPVFNAIRESINGINKEVKRLFGDYTNFSGELVSGPFRKLTEYISKGLTEFFSSDNVLNAGKSIVRGLYNMFNTVLEIILRVKAAWQNVFPAETGERTLKVASAFERFTEVIRQFVYAVGPYFQSFMESFFLVLQAVGSVIKTILQILAPVGRVILGIISVIALLTSKVAELFNTVMRTINVANIMSGVLNVIKTILGLVALAILGVVKALMILNEKVPIFTYLWQGIQYLIVGIAQLIGWFGKLLNTPFSEWGGVFAGVIDRIKGAFAEFKKLEFVQAVIAKINNIFEFLGINIEKLKGVLKNFATTIGNFFQTIVDNFKSGGISKVFQGFLEKIKQVKDYILSIFNGGGADSASRFGGILGGVAAKIKELADQLDAGKIAMLSFGGVVIATVLGVAKTTFAISGFIRSLTGLTGAIKGMFTGAIRQDRPILSVAKAIFLFAIALAELSRVDPDRLKQAASALSGILLIAGGLVILMTVIARFAKANVHAQAITSMMLGMSVAIGILAISMGYMATAFNKLDGWAPIFKMMAMFGVVAAGVVAGSLLLTRFGKSVTFGTAILLAFSIAVTLIIKAITGISWENVKNVADQMSIALAAFAIGLVIVARPLRAAAEFLGGMGMALIGMAVAIRLLASTVTYISHAEWTDEGVKKAAIFIGGLLVLFGAMAVLMRGERKIKGLARVILSVTASIALLALLASAIGLVPTENLIKGGVVIGAFLAIMVALTYVSRYTEKAKPAVIIATVVAVIALCTTMMFLTMVDWDDLLLATGSLVLVMLSFGKAIELIGKNKVSASNITAMIAVLAALSAVVAAMVILKDNPWEELLAVAVALSATLLAFGKAVEYITKSTLADKSTESLVKTLGVVLIAMLSVALIMRTLADVPWENIAATGVAMSISLMAFAKACQMIGDMRLDEQSINKLYKIVIIFAAIGAGLVILNRTVDNWVNFIAISAALSLAMISFGAACKLISGFKLRERDFASLFAVLLSMAAIGGILKLFQTEDWVDFIGTAAAMSIALMAFGISCKLISGFKLDLAGVGSLIVVLGAFAVIGVMLKALTDAHDWSAYLGTALVMSAALLAFVACVKILETVTGFAGILSLLLLAAGMIAIAKALKEFEGVSWTQIGQAVVLVGALALALGLLATVTGYGIGAVIAAGGLALMGLALKVIAEGLMEYSKVPSGTTLALIGLAAGILLLGVAGAAATLGVAGLYGVGKALQEIAKGCEAYAPYEDVSFVDLAGGIMALLGAEWAVTASGLGSLTNKFPQMLIAISNALAAFPENFNWNAFSEMADGIHSLVAANILLGAGLDNLIILTKVLPELAASILLFGMIASPMVDRVIEAFEKLAIKLPELGVQAVEEMVESMINTARDSIPKISAAVTEMGACIEPAFRDAVPWHSPIPWLDDFGGDLFNGFEGALGPEVTAKVAEMSESLGMDGVYHPLINSLTMTYGDAKVVVEKIVSLMQLAANTAASLDVTHSQLLKSNESYARQYGNSVTQYEKTFKSAAKNMRFGAELTTEQIKKIHSKAETAAKNHMQATSRYYKETLDTHFKSLNELTGKTDEFGESLVDVDKYVKDLDKDLSKSGGGGGGMAKQTEQTKKATEAMKEFLETIQQTVESQISLFEKFEKKDPMDPKTILENMRSQIKGVTEWSAQMVQLSQAGISDGLLMELAKMGPEGRDKVAAFAAMTAAELQEANLLFAQSIALPEAVSKALGEGFTQNGRDFVYGLAEGLADLAAVEQAQKTAEEVVQANAEGLGVASPSWKAREAGMYFGLGLQDGIYKTVYGRVIPAVRVMSTTLVTTVKSIINFQTGHPIGVNFVEGLISGINSAGKRAVAAAEALAEAVAAALGGALEIASPSRLTMRFGRYLVEGLAIGIDRNISTAEQSSMNLAKAMQDSLDALLLDVDQPVIRPILDLSGVVEEAGKIDSLLGDKTYSSSLNSPNGTGTNGGVGGVTYNQYITSPKSLSRLEIYRQTNNLLNRTRTANA